jgi:predicted phosphodiesterase
MTILLAQLSDIHIRSLADDICLRGEAIGRAIAAETNGRTQHVIVALCGDLTNTGAAEQYSALHAFIERVRRGIEQEYRKTLVFMLLPGNHDCNLEGDQAARDALLGQLPQADLVPNSIQSVVLKPLDGFFNFVQTTGFEQTSVSRRSPFVATSVFEDSGRKLHIHLFNTAWMSSRRERSGTLHFPLAHVPRPELGADLSIAILHHPVNWFAQPNTMRPLRDKISELAHLVLFGHEHTAEVWSARPMHAASAGRPHHAVHSGALNDDGEQSSFNTLNIDLVSGHVDVVTHTLDNRATEKSFYRRLPAETVVFAAGLKGIGPAGYRLVDEFEKQLDDPGTPINHPQRDPRIGVKLDEIFLYPDLWQLDANHDGRAQKQIKSESVESTVLGANRVLITGGEKSGRSAIAKRLFVASLQKGLCPVLLSGTKMNRDDGSSSLRNRIRTAVRSQYSNIDVDQFEQLPKEHRVAIVDDAHRMANDTEKRRLWLAELESKFQCVVLCGDDMIRIDELSGRSARDSGLWDYLHLVIIGFGEHLRAVFVRKWLLLGLDNTPDEHTLTDDVHRVCDLLNVVLKRYSLPCYPLFLLLLLQQSDVANASVQGGSFGKLFEGLTTALMTRGREKRINIGDRHTYLAALSKRMYDGETTELDLEQARSWHRQYWTSMDVPIEFDAFVGDLCDVGILARTSGGIRFKYTYFFCFFAAYYLNRHLHEAESQVLVRTLAGQLHHRVSAEIMLFLAHMSGNPIVLSEMVGTCRRLFDGCPEATLTDETRDLDAATNSHRPILVPDQPDENRQRLRHQRDADISERLAEADRDIDLKPPEACSESLKRLFEITAAYKTIQILGQALRNVAGSTTRERKEEVLSEIFGLARRMLGFYFAPLRGESLSKVMEEIAAEHRDHGNALGAREIQDQICDQLTGLSQFVCFSVVKHTTCSVGSENLDPTTYRLLAGRPEPLLRILDLSFRLERPGEFPRKPAIDLFADLPKFSLSASLVRNLVAQHMYLYNVEYSVRQAVCAKLSIEMSPVFWDKDRKQLKS